MDYKPLQYYLYSIVNQAAALKQSMAGANIVVGTLPSNTLKMATACLATGPIILVYPFVQKYFISGITIGAVKG
jgi:multiple sugar transport system permease protein/putative aldouronate transport system permease protein